LQATKHADVILRSDQDGEAKITFIADCKRGNETSQLVYLELEVTVAGGNPYPVQTGEFLSAASAGSVSPGRILAVKIDPQDRTKVAVDWEKSLRLR
jgi:hypothetical protein